MGRFIKFIIGGLLVAGSILFAIGLVIGGSFAIITRPDSVGAFILWGVIDFIAFLTGIFLMRG